MNPGLVVKLRPAGPWRIGPDSGARNRVDVIYHSDSLYSAVTSAMARLGSFEEWLDDTARASAAAVRFSSCFPFLDEIGFIVPPRSIWPPTSPALMASRVRWKSARFVPLGIVHALLDGQTLDENHWTVDGASECLAPAGRPGPFRTAMHWNAAVDRLTGATERHATACIEFRAGAGLWAIVSFADEAAQKRWLDPVKAAFRLLADSGFGGERSRGWGRSAAPEFVEGVLPDMIYGGRKRGAGKAGAGHQAPEAGGESSAQEGEREASPEAAAAGQGPGTGEESTEVGAAGQGREGGEEAEAEQAEREAIGAGEEGTTQGAEGEASLIASPDIAPLDREPGPPPPQPEPGPDVVPGGAPSPEPGMPPSDPDPTEPEPAPPTIPPEPAGEPEPPRPEMPGGPDVLPSPALGEGITPESSLRVEVPAPGSQEPGPNAEAPPATAEAESPAPEPAMETGRRAHWVVSLFTPAADDGVDWARGDYTLITRGGRIESPAGSGELKKQIHMIAEGSVLYADGAPRGSAPNVAPDGFPHPVFRAGFAVTIPLPEVG